MCLATRAQSASGAKGLRQMPGLVYPKIYLQELIPAAWYQKHFLSIAFPFTFMLVRVSMRQKMALKASSFCLLSSLESKWNPVWIWKSSDNSNQVHL